MTPLSFFITLPPTPSPTTPLPQPPQCIYGKGKPIRGKFDCALPHETLQFNSSTPTGSQAKKTPKSS